MIASRTWPLYDNGRTDFIAETRRSMRAKRNLHFRSTILLAAALGSGAVACGSDLAKKPGGSEPNSATGGAAASSGGAGSGGATVVTPGMTVAGLTLASGETPTPRLHRLTTSELHHSLQDLL